MLCLRSASLKQRVTNDLLPRHGRKPSRGAGSFFGQLEPSGGLAPIAAVFGVVCRSGKQPLETRGAAGSQPSNTNSVHRGRDLSAADNRLFKRGVTKSRKARSFKGRYPPEFRTRFSGSVLRLKSGRTRANVPSRKEDAT